MKIGEFSKMFDVKKSTVRYYTDKGVLRPIKSQSGAEYDQLCIQDMEQAIKLKNMGFSIEEIRQITNVLRVVGVINDNGKKHMLEMIDEKRANIGREIRRLAKQRQDMQVLKESIVENKAKHHKGMRLECLELLQCPKCKESFDLSGAKIKNMEIMSGQLECSCGSGYIIVDGIILSRQSPQGTEVSSVITNTHWTELLNRYPQELIDSIGDCGELCKEKEVFWNEGKVFLFNEICSEYFLYRFHDAFKEDIYYIFTATNLSELHKMKYLLEYHQCKGKWIFIRYNESVPVKPVADRLLDALGYYMGMLYEDQEINTTDWVIDALMPGAEVLYIGISYSNQSATYNNNPRYHRFLDKRKLVAMLESRQIRVSEVTNVGRVQGVSELFTFAEDGESPYLWVSRGQYR